MYIKYIKLYQDDFDIEVWKQYCDILGVDPSVECVRINVESVEVIEEGQENDIWH